MASLEQAKIPINRERKQRSRIEAEKHIITVHGLPCTEIINSATIRLASEMSLIVTNFTISLSSSSCNYVFFSLILTTMRSCYIFWHHESRMGNQDIFGERIKERVWTKKRELHDLLYTKIAKSGTIGLTSGCFIEVAFQERRVQ